LVNDYGAAIYGILFGGISDHQREKQRRKTKEQFFHRVSLLRPQKQFRVEGYRATAQLEGQVKVPSIDFSWKSDPLSESHANFRDHWRRSERPILHSESEELRDSKSLMYRIAIFI
jgi:hypothetical protein